MAMHNQLLKYPDEILPALDELESDFFLNLLIQKMTF